MQRKDPLENGHSIKQRQDDRRYFWTVSFGVVTRRMLVEILDLMARAANDNNTSNGTSKETND